MKLTNGMRQEHGERKRNGARWREGREEHGVCFFWERGTCSNTATEGAESLPLPIEGKLLFEVAGLLLLRTLQKKRGKGSLGASELRKGRYNRFTF